MKKRIFLKIISLLLVLLIINFAVQNVFHIDFRTLENFVASFGYWGPLVYSILLFLGLSIPFNPMPDYLLVLTAAFLFPPEIAIGATLLSHSLALATNYWMARIFGWKLIEQFSNNRELSYLERLSKKISLRQVFAMRWILPLTGIGIDIVSYASGLARLRFLNFFSVSIVPWTIINIVFFSSATYLKERSLFLFFLFGILFALLTMIILYPHRKRLF